MARLVSMRKFLAVLQCHFWSLDPPPLIVLESSCRLESTSSSQQGLLSLLTLMLWTTSKKEGSSAIGNLFADVEAAWCFLKTGVSSYWHFGEFLLMVSMFSLNYWTDRLVWVSHAGFTGCVGVNRAAIKSGWICSTALKHTSRNDVWDQRIGNQPGITLLR